MLRTKTLISELAEIPSGWAFEQYLKLKEQLTGQDIMVLSPFNPKDKRPSLSVYVNKENNLYRFKDFSSDKSGDALALMMLMFDLTTRGEAAHKLKSDYNQWLLLNDGGIREFKIQAKYKVVEFVKRSWTNLDQKYWTQFHIGSKLLEHYNVFPLDSYKMAKDVDGELHELYISGRHNIYGFFRADGTLYKIYQPYMSEGKFIKVKDYIQGTDQLTYKADYLVICSSLKDIMDFVKLGYKNAEVIAPDSENTLISPAVMSSYFLKYKRVCTLFDNDDPGIKAMETYKNRYPEVNAVHLKMSKDLSDSVKDHGLNKVREVLTPLLKEALCIK